MHLISFPPRLLQYEKRVFHTAIKYGGLVFWVQCYKNWVPPYTEGDAQCRATCILRNSVIYQCHQEHIKKERKSVELGLHSERGEIQNGLFLDSRDTEVVHLVHCVCIVSMAE